MMICAGNWKMNKNPTEAQAFVRDLISQARPEELNSLILIPPALCLESVLRAKENHPLKVGAQNCYSQNQGAFTGENSPGVIKQMGAEFCLVGHSERRELFLESNSLLQKKLIAASEVGITPIFCIGEKLDERQSGKTHQILSEQLNQGLSGFPQGQPLIVAYEPVWAIGTGQVATVEQVEDAHLFIENWLSSQRHDLHGVPLLYGGSVKPENAPELIQIPHVNGFLIGGASLKVDSFLAILRSGNKI